MIERRKIDYHFGSVFILKPSVSEDILVVYHGVESLSKGIGFNFEQFHSSVDKHIPSGEAVTFLRQLVQRVHQTASETDICVFCETEFCGYGIGCFEAYTPYVISESIRILLYYIYGFRSVLLIYLCRVSRAYIMPLKKEHDVFYFLLSSPRYLDLIYPLFPYAGYLQKPIGIALDHFQSLFPEMLCDPFGEMRTYTLYQT